MWLDSNYEIFAWNASEAHLALIQFYSEVQQQGIMNLLIQADVKLMNFFRFVLELLLACVTSFLQLDAAKFMQYLMD